MKKIHIAIGVSDIARSVTEYSKRFGCPPVVVIPHEYALWRTESVNFSIRQAPQAPGALRHLGWEDDSTQEFSQDVDVNGITWERFTAEQQAREIKETWPNSD
jgi:hypothetical protein